jgi:hypothetical protein
MIKGRHLGRTLSAGFRHINGFVLLKREFSNK